MRRHVMLGSAMLIALASERAWGANCQVFENKLLNCGFDGGTTNWSAASGTLSHEAVDGRGNPGSAQMVGPISATSEIRSDCVEVDPSTAYGFGIAHREITDALVNGNCILQVFFYQTLASCQAGGNSGVGSSISLDPGATWVLVNGTTPSPADDGSPGVFARLVVPCSSGPTHTIRYDDAFLGVGMTPVDLQHYSVD